MKNYDVLILGAGASSCMCASLIKNKRIGIIDIYSKPAKKILVTGNGRCNLTNLNTNSSYYNVNIDKYLKRFNVKETLEFFESMGLEWFCDEEKRVYPFSNSAKSVQDILINAVKNVDFFGEQTIEKVKCENECYIVETNKEVYKCLNLVVATGGGSENILKQLNIKHNKFQPSLVALKSEKTKDLSGIKLSNVKVTAKTSKNIIKSDIGEVLFKDNGLSGIVIFNISTIFARSGSYEGEIIIDLMPGVSEKDLIEKIEKRKELNIKTDKLFVGMFQNAVANEIFKQSHINTNIISKKLTKEEIYLIAKAIKNLKFKINGCYDNNQVFSGGVDLQNLTENLEYKKQKNLYFIGEICDVDGECGGFNLQWAWTSGGIVGNYLCLK